MKRMPRTWWGKVIAIVVIVIIVWFVLTLLIKVSVWSPGNGSGGTDHGRPDSSSSISR